MFETPESPHTCPVAAIKLYLDQLPVNSDSLFPKPKSKWNNDQWYCSKDILGKNTLSTMMKNLSQRACLSRKYTNHCIRPTVVTNLKDLGYQNHEIQAVTGHKRTESIENYNKRISVVKKRKISNALSDTLHQSEGKITHHTLSINESTVTIDNNVPSTSCQPTLVLEINGMKLSVLL